MARKRLDLDLDSILPGEEFTIGTSSVTIRPLGLLQYKLIVGKLKALLASLEADGVTKENFQQPEKLVIIAETLLIKCPEVLEEVSDIHVDDLNLLPIDVLVALVSKCLEVNLRSKDEFIKNFGSLTTLLEKIGLLKKADQALPK